MFPIGKIEIDVPECPAVVPNVMGIPSWVVGWGIATVFLIIVAAIIAVAVSYNMRNEEKTSQKRIEMETQVSLARHKKSCDTCGAVYSPVVT